MFKALREPTFSKLHLQSFVLDLLWMFDEDYEEHMKQKYSGIDKTALVETINEELSELFLDAYDLLDKINTNGKVFKLRGLLLQRPDTLIIQFTLNG